MTLRIEAEPVPLRVDEDGVIRVRGSRVALDTIVAAFLRGATPEEILQQYPTLALADIYAVISFYLRQRDDVEGYLQERRERATRARAENEARFDPSGLRARLLARQSASDPLPDASSGV